MSVTPVGGETLVNTTTANTQQTQPETPQAVASDSSGNFVVVWTDSAADGSGSGVYAQRFDASGVAIGGQFRVNSTTANDQDHASVAMDEDGDFVVTWTSDGDGVYAQRYNASGVAQGSEFRVNTTTTGSPRESAVAMDSSGNFVVTWTTSGQDGDGHGVYAQRFNAAGVAQGSEFRVNTTTSDNQNLSAVAMNASGEFVVTFSSGNSNVGVRAQRFNASGVAQGGQIQVNTTTNETQSFGSVAIDSSGNFVVTWSSYDQDASGTWGIYAQRFDSTGAKVGSETLVNTTTAGDQQWSRVAMNSTGDYVITWSSYDQDAAGTWGIYARQYAADGTALGLETEVNTTTAGNQQYSAISAQGTGNFVVVWSGQGSGDASGVFFQRLDDGVNQGPINTVPGAQSTNEDTAIVFSSGNGNLISIADPDAGSSLMRVTLTAANGSITLNGTTGLAFTSGDGTADATMQFTGTLANINTALNGLSFTPTNNFNGTASLTILTSDQGNSGTGGTLTDSDTVNITVNAVNDAPVFNVPGAQSVNEDTNLVFSSGNGNLISITDVDSGGSSIQVTLSATNGTLTLSGTAGLSFSAGDGTSDATMTFTGTRTNINTALAGMFFRASSNYNGAATISLDVNDQGNTGSGGALTDSASVNVTVNAVNDNPVNSVPGAQSTNEDTALVFSSGNGNQISISDVDAGGASVQVTLTATNGTVTLAGVSGLTFTSGSGTGDATMTFSGTIADINAALNGLNFAPTGNFTGAASLQIITNDQGNTGSGGARTDTDTIAITVNATNDAPVNTVPTSQVTNKNVTLTFSTGNGNLISISDVDAGGSTVRVTLTATNGTVTLNGTAGLAFTVGDGTADATMTFTGTIATINARLDGLQFIPTNNFVGSGSLQIITNDLGNTGAGGALIASDTIVVEMATEFKANTTTANNQSEPATAMDAAGNFVVVWTSDNQDGDRKGIYGQRYNAAGVPQGTEFRVNTYTTEDQNKPQVAMDSLGNFVVVWASKDQDGDAKGIYAQRYNASGVAQGGEFRVNTTTTGNQDTPFVAMDGSGNFVVTWKSDRGGTGSDVYAQRYNAAGVAQGGEFRVNTNVTDNQDRPVAAMDFNGNFVIAWKSNMQDGSGAGVYFQRYNSAGVAQGSETQANTVTGGNQDKAAIAMDPNGNFVITWSSDMDQDGDRKGVFARRFDSTGVGQGSQFQVNTYTTSDQQIPSVGMDAQGNFTIAWSSNNQDGSNKGVYAQKYNADGTTNGSEYQVSTTTANAQDQPAVAMSGAGGLVIVWQGNGPGDASGVFGLVFQSANRAPVNTVPGAQVTNEDTPLVFSSGNGNRVSISDIDAGSGQMQVTLTVTNGALTLNGTSGLTFSSGDGVSDATMTFTGTLENINTALNGMSYTPTLNYNGAASLSITTNDQGNSGTGGALSDSDSVNITVNAVNDAPINNAPGAQSTNEDTTLVFSSGNGNQISVADVDAGASPVQVTLTAANGTITLNGVVGLTFSSGDGTADATMTFTGTVANINSALNGLSFIPTPGYGGAASLQIVTDDQGNTGAGGALADSNTINITVTAVNDAPVNSVPGPQATDEDTTLVFSSGNGNQISISDVDAGGANVRVTLTATNGAVTLNGVAGLAFSVGDGTADVMMTFDGTIAAINTALDGLSFTPTLNYNGAASLQIVTNDQGNTGIGGALTDTDTVSITVHAVNDAPANTVPVAQSTNEDTTLVFSAGNGNQISIADVDAGGSPVEVTLTAVNGALTLNGIAGLTFSAGDGTSDATMTFTGTVAAINTALNGLGFTPTLNYNGPASLQIDTTDQGNTGAGGPLSDSDTVAITVNAINDAPVNSVPGPQSVNEDATLTFSTAGGNAITVSDLDVGGGNIQVTLTSTNGTLTLAGVTGLAFSVGDGTADATMTFTGTIADINAALDGLVFAPTTDFNGAASLQIVTNDLGNSGAGGPLTDSDTVGITVAAVNDAPVNTVPGPQVTDEDIPLVFSSGNGNQISISDLDAGGSPVEVTLTATGGTITLSGLAGLTFSTGDGTADATMTFTGTVANVNAALNGLSFSPTLNFNGAATLQIVTNDQGNTGAGGPLSDSSTVGITVNAINDAPINTVPGPQSIIEDNALIFSTAGGNPIFIGDVDSGTSPVEVTLAATNGALTLSGTAGLAFSVGDGTGDATMTFTGTVADINAALDGLAYLPALDYDGPANVSISTNDLGNTGAGGPLSASSNVAITVIPENDAPTIVVPGAQQADTFGLVFSAATGNAIQIIDTDVTATDLVQISLIATNGIMTLGGMSGLTFLAGDGVGDASMTFTGTLVDVNAALDGLSFTPSDMNASIQIFADDLGSNGLGGPQTATTSVSITQVPLIPPPSPISTTPPTTSPATTFQPNATSINREALVASRAAPPPRASGMSFTAQTAAPVSNQFNIRLVPQKAAEMAGMIDDALGASASRLLGLRGGTAGLGMRAAQLTLIDNDLLWNQLDSLARKMERDQFASPMLVGATAGMGMALTSGYLLWCLRGGSLLASALSTMPMWRTFDPLPVLEFWEKQGGKKDDDDDAETETNEAEDASLDTILN